MIRWVWLSFLIAFIFMAVSFFFGHQMLDYTYKSNIISENAYPKTPFVFMAVIFVIGLMFIDSVLKTLKYDENPPGNWIMSLVKSIAAGAAVAWFLLSK